MNRPARAIAALTLAFLPLSSCAPAPPSDAPKAASPQTPAPRSVAAEPIRGGPPPPAKRAKMICRNSQDGRPVECGTPNAVMVGVKEN